MNLWWQKAACAKEATRVFFTPALEAKALEICQDCPVRIECRDDAMGDLEFNQGVRGGTTYEQRVRMAGGKSVIPAQRKRRRWGLK